MPKPRDPAGAGFKVPKHPTLIARHLEARLKEFQPRGPVLAATLVLVQRRCGRKGCHCEKGPRHPTHYLTFKEEGKTRSVYVPQDLLPEVQTWIEEHRRLKTLSQQITRLARAKVRTHVLDRRRKAGRS